MSAAKLRSTTISFNVTPLMGVTFARISAAIFTASSLSMFEMRLMTAAHDSPSAGLPFGLPLCPGFHAVRGALRLSVFGLLADFFATFLPAVFFVAIRQFANTSKLTLSECHLPAGNST